MKVQFWTLWPTMALSEASTKKRPVMAFHSFSRQHMTDCIADINVHLEDHTLTLYDQ